MKSGLEHAAEHINEKGLPSAEQMRSDLAELETDNFQQMIREKLDEYTQLFKRFTAGETLSEEETERMTHLSEELAKLAESIRNTTE